MTKTGGQDLSAFSMLDLFRQETESQTAILNESLLALEQDHGNPERLAAVMRERQRGYILNVASFAALAPIPRYALYSGAKAYVVAFSQALAYELKPSGVRVSVLCPGFTASEFHDVARHSKTRIMRWMELDPRHVAEAGIAGMLKGRTVIIPGVWYKLLAQSLRVTPRSVAVALGGWMTRS